MPVYNSSPFSAGPKLLQPGQAAYSFGSFDDTKPTTKLYFSATSESSGNVITAYVQVWEGPFPVAGQLISTQGSGNVPDVTNAVIASVSLNASGVGTIVYPDASSHGIQALLADFGLALVPQKIATESSAASTETLKGVAFALAPVMPGSNARSIAWANIVDANGATVSAVSFYLQGAINDNESEYADLDHSTTANETRVWTPIGQVNFVRIIATLTFSVATPEIAAKVSI